MADRLKNSFVLYHSTVEALEAMGDPAAAFGVVCALRDYSAALAERRPFDPSEHVENTLALVLFKMAADGIRANHVKWLEGCQRNKRNAVSKALKSELGNAPTERQIESRLEARGELADYMETDAYISALSSLPSGRYTPEPTVNSREPPATTRNQSEPLGAAGNQPQPLATVMVMETVTDKETVTDMEEVLENEPEEVIVTGHGKGGGSGKGSGGTLLAANPREGPPVVPCPRCSKGVAAYVDGVGLVHGFCYECGVDFTVDGNGEYSEIDA